MKKNPYVHLNDKLQQMNTKLIHYLNDIKHVLSLNIKNNSSIIGYFTHSINIIHENNSENFILGNLKIHNVSSNKINNLIICLEVSFSCDYNFSGKYIVENTPPPEAPMANVWMLTRHTSNQEHIYWFKLLQEQPLQPGESVTFSNFSIRWAPQNNYSGVVRGFIYCEEIPEGLAAVNPINLNGTFIN